MKTGKFISMEEARERVSNGEVVAYRTFGSPSCYTEWYEAYDDILEKVIAHHQEREEAGMYSFIQFATIIDYFDD